MRYYGRDEVERIGRAGVYWEDRGDSYLCRGLSSFWLYCEKHDDAFTPWMLSDGFWESWVTMWFSQNTNPGDYFLDIGANVGYYSMWAAAHRCRVIAFEPNPKCSTRIEWANEDNGFNIEIEQIALSDRHGTAELWIPTRHSGGASIVDDGNADGEQISVQIWAFDDIYGISPSERIVAKIDAEGAEPQIWAGMQNQWSVGNMTIVMEYQRDRYDAEAFLSDLFDKADVSLVTTDGYDRPTFKEELLRMSSLEMIVLRSKS